VDAYWFHLLGALLLDEVLKLVGVIGDLESHIEERIFEEVDFYDAWHENKYTFLGAPLFEGVCFEVSGYFYLFENFHDYFCNNVVHY